MAKSVGLGLKAGLQGVKENKELIDLRKQIQILQEELTETKAQGKKTSSLEGEMEDLTRHLGNQAGVHVVPIELIDRDEAQPRTVFPVETIRERVESFRRFGQQSPIILIPLENGRYKLFDGELRYRSAQELKWKCLDSVFIPHDEIPAREKVFENQVVTSIHSQRLHDLDLANAIVQFLVHRHSDLHGSEDRIPTLLNTSIRRLERNEELSGLSDVRLGTPEEQAAWLENLSFRDIEEKWIFEVLLELQLNPLSVNTNVFPLLKLSDDLVKAIQVKGLESSKARELNKISASKLKISEKESKKIRSKILKKVIEEKLSLTKLKTIVSETMQQFQEIKRVDKPHRSIAAVSGLDISSISDLDTLKELKKTFNEKLREISLAIKSYPRD